MKPTRILTLLGAVVIGAIFQPVQAQDKELTLYTQRHYAFDEEVHACSSTAYICLDLCQTLPNEPNIWDLNPRKNMALISAEF